MKAALVLVLAFAACALAVAPTSRPRILTEKQWKHEKNVVIVPKGDPRAYPPTSQGPIPGAPTDEQWVSPAVELRPILSAAVGAYCTPQPSNVRSTPSTSGTVKITTNAGERVSVTTTSEQSSNGYVWVPVTVRGVSGFMSKSLLASCPPAPTPTPAGSTRFPLYKQCGQSWSGATLGSCSGTTVCKAGCAVSSVAMFLKSRGVDTDPGKLNSWLKSNGGFAGCAIYWAKVDRFGKSTCQGFVKGSYAEVCAWAKSGYGVILNVNNGGHWVLATGCDGNNNILVNDPGYARSSYPYSAVGKQVLYK